MSFTFLCTSGYYAYLTYRRWMCGVSTSLKNLTHHNHLCTCAYMHTSTCSSSHAVLGSCYSPTEVEQGHGTQNNFVISTFINKSGLSFLQWWRDPLSLKSRWLL